MLQQNKAVGRNNSIFFSLSFEMLTSNAKGFTSIYSNIKLNIYKKKTQSENIQKKLIVIASICCASSHLLNHKVLKEKKNENVMLLLIDNSEKYIFVYIQSVHVYTSHCLRPSIGKLLIVNKN